MKSKWNIIYYETAKKECPVEDFINSRSIKYRDDFIARFNENELRSKPYEDI
jgi:hypothetical protein